MVTRRHELHTCIGQVVDIQKFAHRLAAAPHHVFSVVPQLGFVGFANEGWQHVAVLQIVVVARAIQVGGHDTGVAGAVLRIEAFAQFDARYFGQRIGLVGWLQGARQQIFLFDRLRTITRVYATRAQEHQVLNACCIGALNEVGLHHQVLVNEVGAVGVVGMDAAHFGRCNEQVVRLFCFQKNFHLCLPCEV